MYEQEEVSVLGYLLSDFLVIVPPSQCSIVITNCGTPLTLQKETIVTRSQIVWCGNDGVLRAKTIFHPNSPIDIRHVDITKLPNEVDKGIGVSWSSMAQPAHGDCISPNTLGINETGEMRYFLVNAKT